MGRSRAPGAWRGALGQAARVHGRNEIRRRTGRAFDLSPLAAHRAAGSDRRRQPRGRTDHPHRGRPRLPRPRHPATDRELGQHADQLRKLLLPLGVAGHLSGRNDLRHRAGLEPLRQCRPRRLRPPAEDALAMAESLLEVRDLHTVFATKHGEVKAVDGVSFEINPGETLGIVGESGSGKSVTAMSVMRLQRPGKIVSGKVMFRGRDLTKVSETEMREIRGQEIAMIFQDPMTSLNPVFRTGWQVAEGDRMHDGGDKGRAMSVAVSMLGKVGIPSPAARARDYPHQFSGGMRQRAMIAMGLTTTPKVLIAD